MSKEITKLEPWQIFKAAIKALGPKYIAKVFGKVNQRSAYDWAQDPAVTEKRTRSPLEMLHSMFEILDSIGRGYVARAAIAYLQTALEPAEHEPVEEVKETMSQEILADYSAVGDLQKSIEKCEPVEEVVKKAQEAKDEIDRTFAKYLDDCGNN